jgi:hypothetical protein
MPMDEAEDARDIMGLLENLGLLELKAGGYVATEFLRMQSWVEELWRFAPPLTREVGASE